MLLQKEALLERLDNDTQLLKEVIGIFLADYPGKLANLRAAVTTRDYTEIADGSHAFRGSISTFGAKDAVDAARKLEAMGRHAQPEGIDEALCALEREITLVACALDQLTKDE